MFYQWLGKVYTLPLQYTRNGSYLYANLIKMARSVFFCTCILMNTVLRLSDIKFMKHRKPASYTGFVWEVKYCSKNVLSLIQNILPILTTISYQRAQTNLESMHVIFFYWTAYQLNYLTKPWTGPHHTSKLVSLTHLCRFWFLKCKKNNRTKWRYPILNNEHICISCLGRHREFGEEGKIVHRSV